MNADGSEQVNLTRNGARDLWGAWSPDGKKIAFTSNRDGNDDIYVMDSDGAEVRRLTSNAAADGLPAWSPDGSEIAFTSDRTGNDDIYVMDSDGTNQRGLTDNPDFDYGPAWSPDGEKIAFTSNRDGNSEVYVMNADGSAQENLTRNPGTEEGNRGVSWSPDGGSMAFTSRGVTPEDTSSLGQTIGIAGILLQTAILMGIVLVALRRWILPFGALVLVFTLSTTLITFIHDQQWLIPVAFVAGLVADLLVWQLKPSAARRGALRLFAFAVPVVLFALYFLAISLRVGIGWSIHLWMGAIVLAGGVGLLMSYVLVPPAIPAEHLEQQET
jgi:WD40 repeat protein